PRTQGALARSATARHPMRAVPTAGCQRVAPARSKTSSRWPWSESSRRLERVAALARGLRNAGEATVGEDAARTTACTRTMSMTHASRFIWMCTLALAAACGGDLGVGTAGGIDGGHGDPFGDDPGDGGAAPGWGPEDPGG